MAEVVTQLGRVSLTPRGAYDAAAIYNRLDVVAYEGSSYLVLVDGTTGTAPAEGPAYMLLAEKGGKGDPGQPGGKGDPGKQGDTGVGIQSIERVRGTGAPGTTDVYAITLTNGETATFTVYNGADGEPGADGSSFIVSGRYDTLEDLLAAHPTGSEGEAWAVGSVDDNDIYLWNTGTGTWDNVGSLQGPTGPAGADGLPALTYGGIVIFSSSRGEVMADLLGASVGLFRNNFNRSPQANEVFIAPVQLFHESELIGNDAGLVGTYLGVFSVSGTSEENLTRVNAVLRTYAGVSGPPGEDGKSAYQIAADNGFTGTEEEWLASLKGADGAAGSAGTDGKTAYQYAVDGGYTGTEEEFQALMGSGPWLPTAGGTMTGDIAGIKSKGQIDLFQQSSSTSAGLNFYGTSKESIRSGIFGAADGVAAIKGERGLGYGQLYIADPTDMNQAATKAYVDSKASGVPSGVIVMWSGAANAIPSGWLLCNGANGTPDLRNRFIVGAGSSYGVGATGGSETVTLTADQLAQHSHWVTVYQGVQRAGDSYGSYTVDANNSVNGLSGEMANINGNINGNQPHENRPPYYALCFIMKQ